MFFFDFLTKNELLAKDYVDFKSTYTSNTKELLSIQMRHEKKEVVHMG